ncbi:MAG: hypothetical protein AAFY60_21175, partial [Myxococcota bacterium]
LVLVSDADLAARTVLTNVGPLPGLPSQTLVTRDFSDRLLLGDINGDSVTDFVVGDFGVVAYLGTRGSPASVTRISSLRDDFEGPGLVGFVASSENDRFGDPFSPTLAIRPFSQEAGQRHWDIHAQAHDRGLFTNARAAQVTPSVTVEGAVSLLRLGTTGDARSNRLRVALRADYPGDDSVDSLTVGANAEESRAFLFELALPPTLSGVGPEDLAVIQRVRDWTRARDYPSDSLFGDAAGADVLPRVVNENTGPQDIVIRQDFLRRVPGVGSLEAGTGPRFTVIDDSDGLRVRILTDRLGIFTVYSDPS